MQERTPFTVYKTGGVGKVIGAHTHESCMELMEICDGCATVWIGTSSFEVGAGDLLFIPSGMVHRLVSETDVSVRGLVFETSILEENMEVFDTEILYMFYLQSKNRVTKFSDGHPVYETLKKYIEECFEEDSAKDVCYKLPIRANIYLCMTALLRYYCGAKNEQDRQVYHNVLRMRPVMEYIGAHFTEKIYVDALAGMIRVSSDYFTRMFKESIGKTPIDYINDLRVNRALDLLSSTELSMAGIAEQIGFCNANYFHKIFKQYMNISPLTYRKINED